MAALNTNPTSADVSHCDVLVIGASLSGSAAAHALASTGRSVVIVDSETFPRRKVCGEGLSNISFNYVESLGVNFRDIPHQILRGYRVDRGGDRLVVRPPRDSSNAGFGVGVTREALDSAVLERVANAENVRVHFNRRAVRSVPFPDSCETLFSDGGKIVSKYVVVAAGGRDSFRVRTARVKVPSRYGYHLRVRSSVEDPSNDEVHIVAMKDFELYATPIGDGIVNLAVLAAKRSFSELISRDGQRFALNLLGTKRGSVVTPLSSALPTGPVGSVRREAAVGRMFYVGDACEQFDPIGGMGMTHAILSGQAAGEQLGAVLMNHSTLPEATKRYERARESIARPLRGFTRMSYLALVTLADRRVARLISNSSVAASFSRAVHHTDRSISTLLSQQLIGLAGR